MQENFTGSRALSCSGFSFVFHTYLTHRPAVGNGPDHFETDIEQVLRRPGDLDRSAGVQALHLKFQCPQNHPIAIFTDAGPTAGLAGGITRFEGGRRR
jgi:hypothetical protein